VLEAETLTVVEKNMSITRRPDPEQLLRQLQAEEQYYRRGRLKIFLGYAGGVGKSFRMLDEARRRRTRGEDVVVGAIQPKVSAEVDALLQKMPVIPLRAIGGVPTMDVEAILRRHPQVCVVDGLAYDNPPGSLHAKRWQDVEHLLSAGISVIATVNLQHIEERREEVERIWGKHVTETVPESFLRNADEIEIVDAPPDFCLQRESSPLTAAETGATTSLPQQLSGLREIALLLAADVVDYQLEAYLARHGIEQLWGAHERILVCVSPYADAAEMIASGRRNADRFHGELFVAYVNRPDITPEENTVLEKNLAQARAASARIEALDGEDPADTIMQFARAHGITQIFLPNRMSNSWWDRIFGRPVEHLIRAAENIDVRVFPV
jgi:two-component system sensor histidine kinase KdpD